MAAGPRGLGFLALLSPMVTLAAPDVVPSWSTELQVLRNARLTCNAQAPPTPLAYARGARHQARRRKFSFARLLGLAPADDNGDALPFKLPRLSLMEALIGCFVIMIGGLLVAGQI